MDPLADADFWRRLDERVDARLRRIAQPVRGVIGTMISSTLRLAGAATFRALETAPEVEVAQHFGFHSVPPAGTEVVAIPIGGSSGHRVIVAELDPAFRPTDLQGGEGCIYSIGQAVVVARADGSIELRTAAGVGVKVDAAGLVKLDGGGAGIARVGDAVTVTGTVTIGPSTYPVTASGTIASGSTTCSAGG